MTRILVGAAVMGLLAALAYGALALFVGRAIDPISAGLLVAAGYLIGAGDA